MCKLVSAQFVPHSCPAMPKFVPHECLTCVLYVSTAPLSTSPGKKQSGNNPWAIFREGCSYVQGNAFAQIFRSGRYTKERRENTIREWGMNGARIGTPMGQEWGTNQFTLRKLLLRCSPWAGGRRNGGTIQYTSGPFVAHELGQTRGTVGARMGY